MDQPLFMDAVITPHRSLSQRGFIVLLAVMTSVNVGAALLFVTMGAAPVPIFLGLDLAAVVVAFVASNRAARRREHVQVTSAEVRVLRQIGKGEAETVWTSPTAFTQVALAGPRGEEFRLDLTLSGRRLAVGQALSRPELVAFAEALHEAIARARSGRLA